MEHLYKWVYNWVYNWVRNKLEDKDKSCGIISAFYLDQIVFLVNDIKLY
jgi:hypothetical protein